MFLCVSIIMGIGQNLGKRLLIAVTAKGGLETLEWNKSRREQRSARVR